MVIANGMVDRAEHVDFMLISSYALHVMVIYSLVFRGIIAEFLAQSIRRIELIAGHGTCLISIGAKARNSNLSSIMLKEVYRGENREIEDEWHQVIQMCVHLEKKLNISLSEFKELLRNAQERQDISVGGSINDGGLSQKRH